MRALHSDVRTREFSCFNSRYGSRLDVSVGDDCLSVHRSNIMLATLFYTGETDCIVSVTQFANLAPDESVQVVSAGIEALLANRPHVLRIHIRLDDATARLHAPLLGAAIITLDDGVRVVRPELFWQRPVPWLATTPSGVFPQFHVMTSGRRHPLRPAKPEGTVYARFIPWLGEVISFRTIDMDKDIGLFNRWMNDPRVAQVWDEAGNLDEHLCYLQTGHADPHNLALIGCFNDVPFGYFEIYWAKENRLGPYYDADDYDRGWHVAIGEDAYRGKARVGAWLPSLMHFIFLDDPRTQRIVGEPLASHTQQIRNLERSGFAKIKHVDFPHKRALLVMLLRERYFGDRLWLPAHSEAGTPSPEFAQPIAADTGRRMSA